MKISISNYLLATTSLASLASAKNIFDNDHPSKKKEKNNNGRRVGQLGKHTSKGASAADCAKDLDVQLFKDSSVLKFGSSKKACRSGKGYAGSTKDGKKHITLVPGGRGNAFRASLTDDETGAVYSIGPDADGVMTTVERFQEDYGDELDPEDAMKPKERALFEAKMMEGSDPNIASKPAAPISTGGLRGKVVADQLKDLGNRFLRENRNLQTTQPDTTIDVMVVWTDHAECKNSQLSRGCTKSATTKANIRATIDLAIQETNVAYSESGVLAELNLVHAYPDYSYTEATSDAFGTALDQITSTTDGVLDGVHAERELYKADVVALIIDDPQYCGLAWLGPSKERMFSVTAWNCATGYYSFGHEIGHNMGCNHDKGTSGACSNPNYNYGYRDPSTNFRSILAYNCGSNRCTGEGTGGCTRVQRFSNPNYKYNGADIGTAQIDNARRINDVRQAIAGYYISGAPGPTPLPTSPPLTGLPTPPPSPPPTPAPTPCIEKSFKVDINADNYPGETTWTLQNTCTTTQVASGGPYGSQGTFYTSGDICVGDGEFTFTINDSFGDGICCGYGTGSYTITYDGSEVATATGGAFGSSESTTFGSCGPVPTPPPTTSNPTESPTQKPTSRPTTPAPTANPTAKPSSAPTNVPTGTSGPVIASFDTILGVPKCSTPGTSCTTGNELILGTRSDVEPNPSNSLDGCVDGSNGAFHGDESIDKITVSTVGGGPLQSGQRVEIEANVWAWSTGGSDTADFYSASDANNVAWTYLGSVPAGGADARTLKMQYDLPAGALQAVRVNFRYQGAGGTGCAGGSWDDVDDLVFSVLPGALGDVVNDVVAADVPPTPKADCKALDDRDRCLAASCKWKNGRNSGCYDSN